MRIGHVIPAAVLTAALAAPAGAVASVGTGVGATPLALRPAAHPGTTYRFPPLYVKNTGTVSARYTVRVQRITRGRQQTVPASWITLRPTTLRLAPRKIASVSVTVTVPRGASGGAYMTDLVATTYAAHRPGAPALGAAAADTLSFAVSSPSAFPVWLAGVGAAALLVLAGIGWKITGRRRTARGLAPASSPA